jgi:hypothetical protein
MYWDIRTTLNWRLYAWEQYSLASLKLDMALQYVTGAIPKISDIPEGVVAADDRMLLGPELFELVNKNRLRGLPALNGGDGQEIFRQGESDLKDLMTALPAIAGAAYRSADYAGRLASIGLDFSLDPIKYKDEYRVTVEKLQSMAGKAKERFSIDLFSHAKSFAAAAEQKKVFEALQAAYVGFQSWKKKSELDDVLKAEESTVANLYALADKLVASTEESSAMFKARSNNGQVAFDSMRQFANRPLASFVHPDVATEIPTLVYSAVVMIGTSYLDEINSYRMASVQQDIEDLKALEGVVQQLRETWKRVISIHEWAMQTHKRPFWNWSEDESTASFDTRDLVLPMAVVQYRLAQSRRLNDFLEPALSKASTGTALADRLSVIRALNLMLQK